MSEEGAQVKTEAEGWVAEEIARLRSVSYDALLDQLVEATHQEMTTSSGKVLIRETQVLWDGRKGGPLRVTVDVWDPAAHRQRRRLGVITSVAIDDFIRAPDGNFIDEDPA